jgi:hypothetical protein
VIERFDEEAARAGGRVEHGFAEARIGDGDHEADDGARRVELAGIACGIAHLAEHGFVECTERVQLVAGGEVDAVELVDDVAQQVAADHAVLHALEDGRNHIPTVVAVGTGERAQIAEQTRTLIAVGSGGFLVVDEGEEFVTCDAVRLGGPVAPAIGRFEGGFELFRGEPGLALALKFQVIEKFQEHDPGKHWQPVQVPVQTFILPHNIPGGLEQCSE